MIFTVLAASAAMAITPADVAAKPWLGQVDTSGWTLIAMTIKKNRINLYRPVGGPPTGDIQLAWVRRECEQGCSGSDSLSGVILYRFNCAASSDRILLDLDYRDRNLQGASAENPYLAPEQEDDRVVGDTVPSRAFALACHHAPAH